MAEQEKVVEQTPESEPNLAESAQESEANDATISQEGDSDHEFVKFQDPATERRFKHVWKRFRGEERVSTQLAADNKALLERLETVEQNVAQTGANSATAELRSQKIQAFENGEWDRAAQIDEQMLDIKVAAASSNGVAANGSSKVHETPADPGGLSSEDRTYVEHWQREKNDDGSQKRPWADPGHAYHARALRAITTISQDPEFEGAPLEDILVEADLMMGVTKGMRPAAGAVLSNDGNAGGGRGKKTPALSAEQKAVAAKMDMTVEQYAKAMQKHSRSSLT